MFNAEIQSKQCFCYKLFSLLAAYSTWSSRFQAFESIPLVPLCHWRNQFREFFKRKLIKDHVDKIPHALCLCRVQFVVFCSLSDKKKLAVKQTFIGDVQLWTILNRFLALIMDFLFWIRENIFLLSISVSSIFWVGFCGEISCRCFAIN